LNGIDLDSTNGMRQFTALAGVISLLGILLIDRGLNPDKKEDSIYENRMRTMRGKGEREVKISP